MISGIYCIKCLVNNKKYIGSATDFNYRKYKNFGRLKYNSHNSLIQVEYNKYGKENFVFEILEEVDRNNFKSVVEFENYLCDLENNYMELYKTHVPTFGLEYGYNMQRATRPNENSRKLNSIKNMGENNPMYGKTFKMTEEQINSRKHGMEGKPSPRRNLSDKQCFEIKESFINKDLKITWQKLYKILAEKYGVSTRVITAIKEGKHWSNRELLNGGYRDWIK
jgi:group I intron endonuclease